MAWQFSDLYGRTLKFASSSDTASAKSFVNSAYREIIGKCDLNPKTSSAIALTAGTVSYTITGAPFSIADFLNMQHFYYTSSGQNYRMEQRSLEEILELRAYAAAIAPPGLYYVLNGTNNLELYPAPATGDTVTLYYNAAPTALSADGDTASLIPDEYQWLVPVRAGQFLADYEDAESYSADTLLQKYEYGMVAFHQWLRNRRGEQQKRIPVGYLNRRAWRRHDESTYYSGDRS